MSTTNEHPELPAPSEETQWLAYRYVLGEMTREESEAFEHSLQDDPNRCESVAIAVQTVQAVADSETSDQPMIPSFEADTIRVRWGFVGASLLACVVVISLWLVPQPERIAELQPQFDPPPTSNDSELDKPNEQAEVDDSRAGELVSLWTRSSIEIDRPTPQSTDEWTELVESPDEDIESDSEFGWVLAAVSQDSKATPESSNTSVEN